MTMGRCTLTYLPPLSSLSSEAPSLLLLSLRYPQPKNLSPKEILQIRKLLDHLFLPHQSLSPSSHSNECSYSFTTRDTILDASRSPAYADLFCIASSVNNRPSYLSRYSTSTCCIVDFNSFSNYVRRVASWPRHEDASWETRPKISHQETTDSVWRAGYHPD